MAFLFGDTNRLRASAVAGLVAGATATDSAAAAAGCRLTYGQAVYWIESLLVTVDKFNRQLEGVEEADCDWEMRGRKGSKNPFK